MLIVVQCIYHTVKNLFFVINMSQERTVEIGAKPESKESGFGHSTHLANINLKLSSLVFFRNQTLCYCICRVSLLQYGEITVLSLDLW